MEEFYTSVHLKRPVRLSAETRHFAYESLQGKYGAEARKTPVLYFTPPRGYADMTPLEKHDLMVSEIAKGAPLRICEGERISGAATLGDAIRHFLPAAEVGKTPELYGIDHLTVDFSDVLSIGMDGIEKKVHTSRLKHTDPQKKAFLESCLHTIDSMRIFHARYLAALADLPGYEKNLESLRRVPFSPAESFYEAVQSIWFVFVFLRLLGNWPGIGRLDVLLGDYLDKDLRDGVLTLSEAREILAHFFIKGCEWIGGSDTVSGDAQHYQNIVLAGTDENDRDVTNALTYLVLDIVEETGISDFPITIRLHRNTDEKLLRRAAEVIRFGGGTVAVYGEELVLSSLEEMGYQKEEARTFANDGCWEVQMPGRTYFSYTPFDALGILQHITLSDYQKSFSDFGSLMAAYKKDIAKEVAAIFEARALSLLAEDRRTFRPMPPCTAVSLFEKDCIGRGLSYREGGTDYFVISPHIGGLPDAVNSLYALRNAVFSDKLVSFSDFSAILRRNWADAEKLLKTVQTQYTYFGNGNPEADSIAAEILDAFADACAQFDKTTPIRFVPGVSTFGRQVDWAPKRMATPFGRRAGEILSGNLSPTPGTDTNGCTAIIKSYTKMPLRRMYSGAALDIGLMPADMENENAVQAIMGLLRGFTLLDGFFMQLDAVDKATLLAAQKDPASYKNLSVRVSGWNARFVTLGREWQDMIISRAK